jgi:hypothetical protein
MGVGKYFGRWGLTGGNVGIEAASSEGCVRAGERRFGKGTSWPQPDRSLGKGQGHGRTERGVRECIVL